MFCNKCGKELPENAGNFCPNCGEEISARNVAESTSTNEHESAESQQKAESSITEKKQGFFAKYKKFIIPIAIALAVVMAIIAILPSEDVNDPIESLKGVVFEDFGTLTLGNAAEKNLSNIKWTTEKINDEEHTVKLEGYSTKYIVKLAVEFDVTFVDDMVYASASTVWIDGDAYTDDATICEALELIYE